MTLNLHSLRHAAAGSLAMSVASLAFGVVPVNLDASRQTIARDPVAVGGITYQVADDAEIKATLLGEAASLGLEVEYLTDAQAIPLSEAINRVAETEFRFALSNGAWGVTNSSNEFFAQFDSAGFDLTSYDRDWSVDFRLVAVGRDGSMAPASSAILGAHGVQVSRRSGTESVRPGVTSTDRLDLRRAGLVEWYRNDVTGLEQGFDLVSRPAGAGEIVMLLGISGSLTPALAADGSIELRNAAGDVSLYYRQLIVWDSTGRALPGSLSLTPGGVAIRFDDAGAIYPVTVDPLLTTASQFATTNTQIGAAQGASISSAGDVNGDGNDDFVIGLPKWDNTVGRIDAGRAMFGLGSPSGLGGIVVPILTISSAQTGAELGTSVSEAGDVNGDTFGDFLIGEPLADITVQTSPGPPPVLAVRVDGGRAILVTGQGTLPYITFLVTISTTGPQAGLGERRGQAVAGGGDSNGDVFADFVVGRPGIDFGAALDSGGYTSYYGKAAVPFVNAYFGVASGQAGGAFGSSAARGDLNGDGLTDSLLGAPLFDASAAIIDSGAWAPAEAYIPENVFQGGFIWFSTDPAYNGARRGAAVASGDFNGDGIDDQALGAPLADQLAPDGGLVVVYEGPTNNLATNTNNPSPGNFSLAYGYGVGAGTMQYGSSLSGHGNPDCDPYDDLLVGAPGFDLTVFGNEGFVDQHRGSAAGLSAGAAFAGTFGILDSRFGSSVDWADLDGDGLSEALVGVPFVAPGGGWAIFPAVGDPAECAQAAACPCDGFNSHGGYVSCVAHYVNDLRAAGTVTGREGAQIVQDAAHSPCSK